MHPLTERLVALIDQHNLWDEVQRYSGWNRERVVACTTMTTSDFEDVCYGASINSYKLYNDAATIVVSPLAWQRELDRRAVEYQQVADKPLEIRLPLTVEEWCSLYQRGGDYYIGDLEAEDSVQVRLDKVFRDNGWAAVATLAAIAYAVSKTSPINWDHWFQDSKLLQKPYYKLIPPQKLAVIWLIVKEEV